MITPVEESNPLALSASRSAVLEPATVEQVVVGQVDAMGDMALAPEAKVDLAGKLIKDTSFEKTCPFERTCPFGYAPFRNKDKVEVDIVIQQGPLLAGIEIKASATVTSGDFKGLSKLREACREDFSAGVVFYDGENVLPFGNRMFAVPISAVVPIPHMTQ